MAITARPAVPLHPHSSTGIVRSATKVDRWVVVVVPGHTIGVEVDDGGAVALHTLRATIGD
jgi:hypothetical protein